MADPFSIVVSAAGLAGFGLQIIQVLNAYAGSATDAKGRINAISNEMRITVQVLTSFESDLRDEHHLDLMSGNAKDIALDAIKICGDTFNKIDKLLEGAASRALATSSDSEAAYSSQVDIKVSLIQKLRWPLVEPKLDLLRGNLEKVKTTLQLLLGIITLAYMRKISIAGRDNDAINVQAATIRQLVSEKHDAEVRYSLLRARFSDLEVEETGTNVSKHTLFPLYGSQDISHQKDKSMLSSQSGSPVTGSLNLPIPPPLTPMEILHGDYVACMTHLEALQKKMEEALGKLFLPNEGTGDTSPRANQDLSWSERLEVHGSVEYEVNQACEHLRYRILDSSLRFDLSYMARKESVRSTTPDEYDECRAPPSYACRRAPEPYSPVPSSEMDDLRRKMWYGQRKIEPQSTLEKKKAEEEGEWRYSVGYSGEEIVVHGEEDSVGHGEEEAYPVIDSHTNSNTTAWEQYSIPMSSKPVVRRKSFLSEEGKGRDLPTVDELLHDLTTLYD